MTTALSTYGTNIASTTLSTANKLATATGGTAANISTKIGTSTGWGEVFGTSSAWAAAGSIGSQSGNGWLLDATTLEGQELLAGTWGASIRFSTSVGSITTSITMRASKRSSAGVYTTIGSLTLSGQTINTTLTTFTLTSASLPSMTFATGDKLYIDVWLNIATNSTGSSTASLNCSVSSTSTGLAGRVEMDTAGYAPYDNKDFSLRARVAQAKNFALRARIAQAKNFAMRARVQLPANTRTKDFSLRARLAQTKDFKLRARIAQSKDFKLRARIARSRDFAFRAGIQSSNVLGTDTYVRANQTNWGIATDGQAWAYIDGSQASSITGNAGQITSGTGSALFTLGSKTAQDVDLKIRAYITGTAGDRMGVLARLQNATTYYRVAWEGGGNLKIEKSLADTVTTLASSAFSVTSLQYYWIRAQVYGSASGTVIKAKIWQDGTGEPSSWTVTTTDTNPLSGPGQFGVYLFTGSSANVVSVNNFTALSLTNPHDFALRARIGGRGNQDFALRARMGGHPTWRDWAMRARLRGLGSRDFALRANIDNTVIPLPVYVAGHETVTISGVTYPVLEGSLKYSEDASGRSTCSFILLDPTGTVHFRFRQPVVVTHSVRGQIFRGFVDAPQEQNLPPNLANELQVSCIDEHWLADKRAYEGNEFSNQYAGDIATFYAQELAQDNVTSGYAIDYDTTQADFAEGTLSNVVAAANIGSTTIGDGDLELAPAGLALTVTESTYGDFLAGTATGVQANGLTGPDPNGPGYLSLQVQNGIKFTGTCTIAGGGNLYSYVKIWSGGYTIQSSDTLSYRVWIASTSPAIMSGVDIVFTDGTTLRDSTCVDQQGIGAHPNNDLSFFASDQWYNRTISLAPVAGKTTAYVTVAFEGDKTGEYLSFFENIQLGSVTVFNGSLNVNPPQQMQNAGYINVFAVVAGLFEKTGYRISPSYDLSSAGMARSSLLSWQDTTTQTDNGIFALADKNVTMTVESSLDGGITWQPCTSGQSIPGLLPGMLLAGKSLLFRETITNGGSDATQTAAFYGLQATIIPSYAGAQKVDIATITALQQDWQNGTLTNLLWQNGSLGLNGSYLNWANASLAGMTVFGGASPSAGIFETELVLHSGTGADCRARLDNVGSWQNFIAECDVNVGQSNGNYGIVYRTTGWQNNNDTYAYSAFVNTTQIALGRGTNASSGTGTFTQIATATLALSSGNWHRLKVVVNGSTHQLYLDDVLYITATDSTYTGAGQFGLRYYNNSGVTAAGSFGDFGVVQALSGTRISPPVDLSSALSVQDSYIDWTWTGPGSSMLEVDCSIDGGATWTPVNRRASLASVLVAFAPGSSLSGVKLQTRVTLTTATATQQPTISGLSLWIIGTMTASGYRLNSPLALGPVGRVGSSLINWTATLPSDDTTLGVDVSLDGVNWTDVTGLNGQPIPLFVAQQDPPFIDTFGSDNTASYTSGNIAAGSNSAALWAVSTANRRIVGTGGQDGLLVMSSLAGDGEIWIDADWCDNGGVVWALSTDATSCYFLQVQDSQAARTPNRMRLFKVVQGAYSQLGPGAALNFVRGAPTRFHIVQLNGTITITVHSAVTNPDGAVVSDVTQTLSYTDPSPLLPGSVALRSSGGTNRYYQLRSMAYGQDVTQATLYARLRLATSDPTVTPQIQDFAVAVRNPNIASGALIPTTTHSSKSGSTNTLAQNLDDLARQSSITDTYWWRILNQTLYFQPQTAQMAPFVVTNKDMLATPAVTVSYDASLYRNESIIIGGTDVQTNVETYVADGFAQAFTTGGPIESIDAILVNGQPVSFGVQGVDTGKQWYYQIGKTGLTQDSAALPLPAGTHIQIQYEEQINVVAKARNNGQIALMASIDGTSGVVTVVEQAQGLNSAAAQTLALSRIAQYAKLAKTITFTTNRPGLHMGQLLTVFLPQHQIQNETFLVTQVDYAPVTAVVNGQVTLLEQYKVVCTSGPIVGGFQHLFG